MTWTLRKKFSLVFIALEALVLGVAVVLAILFWKEMQLVRHIRQSAWPVADAAMESRIILLREENALLWSHWGGSLSLEAVENLRAQQQKLFQRLKSNENIRSKSLTRLEDLEKEHYGQMEAMWPQPEGATQPRQNSESAGYGHRKAMSTLESISSEMDSLLMERESEADTLMSRLVARATGHAYTGAMALLLLGVVMLGLTEFARQLLRRLVVGPVEQLVAEVKEIKARRAGYRVTLPRIPELRLLAREINSSLERLEEEAAERRQMDRQLIRAERLSSLGVVTAGIVHNLKGPLTAIMGFGEFLKMNHPELEEAASIVDSARRMHAMLQDILARGRKSRSPEAVDLNALLRRELDFLQADLRFKHEVEKVFRPAEKLPLIECVYSDLSQVFENLLRNAIDALHGQEVKRLTVTTACDGKDIVVEVSDTGCGIPEADIPHLFEPFFTTKTALPESGEPVGTGLGLYTVERLLEPYHARVEVDSTVGLGTSVRVGIPLVESNEEVEASGDS